MKSRVAGILVSLVVLVLLFSLGFLLGNLVRIPRTKNAVVTWQTLEVNGRCEISLPSSYGISKVEITQFSAKEVLLRKQKPELSSSGGALPSRESYEWIDSSEGFPVKRLDFVHEDGDYVEFSPIIVLVSHYTEGGVVEPEIKTCRNFFLQRDSSFEVRFTRDDQNG